MQYVYLPKKHALEVQKSQMNQELALYGFHLTQEQIKTLYKTMSLVCQKYQMIETDPSILFRFVFMIYDFKYIKSDGLMEMTQRVMDVFYALRSIYPVTLSDDDLLDRMKIACKQNHGVMDKKTRHIVMKMIEKEGLHANDDEV